ncbi:MAG: ribonuclease P protein component [Phycisphaerales bacterium]|nr:ribonuclease P protein component [Phycisphaerales bacterium]
MSGPVRQHTYRRRHRLRLAREYAAVSRARLKKVEHPLVVQARITDQPEPRLGLSIGRRVGNAVARNAVKRRLREAFRLMKQDIPRPPGGGNYDLVVSASAHELLGTGEYRARIERALAAIHRVAVRREQADEAN